MADSAVTLFCCKPVLDMVPRKYIEELCHVLRLAGPLIFLYLCPFVTTMFCGRLGNDVLAGYGLAVSTINISVKSTGTSVSLACDTLVSQIFGGKNYLRVGVILQRGIIFIILLCLPYWGLLINAEPILLCLGQKPEVARIAQVYIKAYLPAVPATLLFELQLSYLKNQCIILPQVCAGISANIANVATNFILVSWLDLGVSGSAAANCLAELYRCSFLFVYIRCRKLHKTTWGGWSTESLQEWGSFMRLVLPSGLMCCFEWWFYEIAGFLAGLLGEVDLAANHVVMLVVTIVYMVPLAVNGAVCARMGNAFGAGDTAGALLSCKVSLMLTVFTGIVNCIVLVSSKPVIGLIFTSDGKIVGLVSTLISIYCVHQVFEGLNSVCQGIFLAMGKQKIPAMAYFFCYYCAGLPLAVLLMFVAKLRLSGFWIGLFLCFFVQFIIFLIIIFKMNWEKITEEAVERAQKATHLRTDTEDRNGPIHLAATGINSAEDYIPENTPEPNAETELAHQVLRRESSRLSTPQLMCRRGLAMLAAVLLLVVGVTVHFLVPLPEILPPHSNFTLDRINATFAPDQILSTMLNPK